MTCRIAGYLRGVYISRISQNENFREDCTREVATLGTCTWVWFSINYAKINSTKSKEFQNSRKYISFENNPLYGVIRCKNCKLLSH